MTDPKTPAAVSVRLAPGINDRLKRAAEERLLGRDKLIEVLLEDGLRRLTPVAELPILRDPDGPAYDQDLAEADYAEHAADRAEQ